MKKKLLIGSVMLIALCAVLSALAQSQSQSQSQQPAPPVYSSAGSTIDNQGVRGYKLGPGDVLDVKVWGQEALNTVAEIDEDGNLSSLPFIDDPIPAKCRTEMDIQKSVTEAYERYLVKPRVSVRTIDRKSRPPATIYGSVLSPKPVMTIRRLRLHEMVAAAGGFTASAGGTIQIVHTVPELCPEPGELQTNVAKGSDVGEIQIYEISLLKSGAPEGDPSIRPGDIVYVAEGDPVFVTGLVFNPQTLIIRDAITLQTAIAKSGGLQRLANAKDVHIWRKKDGKMGGDDIKVNLEAIRKGQENDIALQPYDVIDVRELGIMSGKKLTDLLSGLPLTAVTRIPVH
jgi:polysaccharide biosynthesis/export protein